MSWFRGEDKYGVTQKNGGRTPDKDHLTIENSPPLLVSEQKRINKVKKALDKAWMDEAKEAYDAVYHGKPYIDESGMEDIPSSLKDQAAISSNFWHDLRYYQRIAKLEYLAGEQPMETWDKILPVEPPSKRVFPHLVEETRRTLNFPTQRAMTDFEDFLGQIRSYVDLNPPPGLIGVEMDPDPITRKIRHSEMALIARNRVANEAKNPPPLDKPRYEIHGIKDDIWLDAAQCMARKLNKLDDSIPLTITQVPIRHWKAHMATQSTKTHGSNVEFESGSTVYVTKARPDSFGGYDSLGGSWEFANHLTEKFGIDVDPCWRKVLSTKGSVANKLSMTNT
eukprot:TRINITY_DN6907_c0_g1_i1.p1 TRINITY_DN6907_c0_g1~~TRINITY_DN6907_c0_g1_i1.p1  ORF type:complete len:337 (+),score=102.74 TRINITY_DN6907_c0_g1_i1:337-1347(+)